jgi:hypothetical protein
MRTLNLNIDSLALNITNAESHEHRVRPIAARAAVIFLERVEAYYSEASRISRAKNSDRVNALPVSLDLSSMTDEHAAQRIALFWLDALKLKLM